MSGEVNLTTPDVVYHYTDARGFEGILKSKRLRQQT
jgi:hypothetical protein